MATPLHLDTAEYEFLVSPLTSRPELPTEPTTGSVWVACYGGSILVFDDTATAPDRTATS